MERSKEAYSFQKLALEREQRRGVWRKSLGGDFCCCCLVFFSYETAFNIRFERKEPGERINEALDIHWWTKFLTDKGEKGKETRWLGLLQDHPAMTKGARISRTGNPQRGGGERSGDLGSWLNKDLPPRTSNIRTSVEPRTGPAGSGSEMANMSRLT